MTLEYVIGDLLEADLPAIAHGCNTKGVMGSGIAKTIGERYPVMLDIYQSLCREEYFYLGGLYPYVHTDEYTIYNLGTQIEPGPHADLVGIAVAVKRMVTMSVRDGIYTIGLPRIGAGIGGLRWADVQHALQVASHGSNVKLVIYTLPDEIGKFS